MPWCLVSWGDTTKSKPHECVFFDAAVYGDSGKARSEARRFAEEKFAEVEPWGGSVRLIEGRAVATWGPLDPGGAFNSMEVQHEIDYDKGVKGYD